MQVAIEHVKVGTRRAVDQKNVEMLAESIRAIGLQNPIVLTEDLTLVSGRHRLEAVKQLGHDLVEANILPLSSEEAELAEIDENLVRKDLSYLEQGQLIQRREDLLTIMGIRAKKGGQIGNSNASKNEPASGVDSFKTTKDLAAEIGLKETAVKERKRVARDITIEVQETIIGTPLADKANQLQELARKAPEEQKAIAEVITSGQAATVKEAVEIIEGSSNVLADLDLPNAGQLKEQAIKQMAATYDVIYVDATLKKDMKNPLKAFNIAENATLFLWAFEHNLDTAIDLGRAWGFKYRGGFVWDKRYDTQGSYHMRNHAHLLIFGRGKHEPTHKKPDWGSIWSQEARDFSVKPVVFKQVVQQLFADKEILEV